MSLTAPKTTDLEGTITEFHEFFNKRKLYLTRKDIHGTRLSECDIVQDKPLSFIRLTRTPSSEIRYVGAVLRNGQFGGRVEIYRIRDIEGYKIALVKQGQVIDETGSVMSLQELAHHPGYVVNKKD
ncbi:MAG: hypothetical protein CXT77_04520 [uncultured DHVE6 group euryarchaeote]|jgi:hypothetical protein|nr:MAG: hypothetical protein CXT77_04520 [uncultured DHVE6 group euryarchaeote]